LDEGVDAPFVAWSALALLLLTSSAAVVVVSLALPDRPLLWALLAQPLLGAMVWVGANGPLEGKVLLSFGGSHGLTTSDLVVLVPVLAAGAVVHRIYRLGAEAGPRTPRRS
jgi:hypothetical protein